MLYMRNQVVSIFSCFVFLFSCKLTDIAQIETEGPLINYLNPHAIKLNQIDQKTISTLFSVLDFNHPDSCLLWAYKHEDWEQRAERYKDSNHKTIIILKNQKVDRVVIVKPPVFHSFFDISAGKCERIDSTKILLSDSVYILSGNVKSVYADTYVKSDSAILNLSDSSITFFEGFEIGPLRGMYAQTFKAGKLTWKPNCHWSCETMDMD